MEKTYSLEEFMDLILPSYKTGGKIHIKPENRGKFTALKKRTGKSASWFKEHGTPAQKKMATFALNAKKWKHQDGSSLTNPEYESMTPIITFLNRDKNFVQRAMNPELYPYILAEDGSRKTHLMEYSTFDDGYARVYPTIVQKNSGDLEELNSDDAYHYAVKTGEYIDIPNIPFAKWYSENGLINHIKKQDGTTVTNQKKIWNEKELNPNINTNNKTAWFEWWYSDRKKQVKNALKNAGIENPTDDIVSNYINYFYNKIKNTEESYDFNESVPVTYGTLGGYYHPEIEFIGDKFPATIKYFNDRPTTKIHERSHAGNFTKLDDQNNHQSALENMIYANGYDKYQFLHVPNDEKYNDFIDYINSPAEKYARLMQFRYDNHINPRHIWTRDEIKEWLENGKFDGYNFVDDVDNLLHLMNDVAENNTINELDNNKAQSGGIIDPLGQWAHPGKITIIPSNKITMDGVNYDVLGVSDTGDVKLMTGGNDYKFNGNYVTEYPLKHQTNPYIDLDIFSYNNKTYGNNRKFNMDNMKLLDEYFIGKGVPLNQRQAILFNVLQESGADTLDAHGNGYYGIMGWSKDRYDSIKDKSLLGQAEYLYNTLYNGNGSVDWNHGGKGSGYNSWTDAKNMFINGKTFDDINHALIHGYIRPSSDVRNYRTTNGSIYFQPKKLEGSFVPLPTVDRKMSDFSSALSQGFLEGDRIADITGSILNTGLNVAAAAGKHAYEKKKTDTSANDDDTNNDDNTNDVYALVEPTELQQQMAQMGGKKVTAAIIEDGEMIEYPDGTILADKGKKHEYSGDNIFRPDGKIDGDKVNFTGVPLIDIELNPTLYLVKKGSNPTKQGEPFIYPSTMNQNGYINTKIGDFFPEAHNENVGKMQQGTELQPKETRKQQKQRLADEKVLNELANNYIDEFFRNQKLKHEQEVANYVPQEIEIVEDLVDDPPEPYTSRRHYETNDNGKYVSRWTGKEFETMSDAISDDYNSRIALGLSPELTDDEINNYIYNMGLYDYEQAASFNKANPVSVKEPKITDYNNIGDWKKAYENYLDFSSGDRSCANTAYRGSFAQFLRSNKGKYNLSNQDIETLFGDLYKNFTTAKSFRNSPLYEEVTTGTIFPGDTIVAGRTTNINGPDHVVKAGRENNGYVQTVESLGLRMDENKTSSIDESLRKNMRITKKSLEDVFKSRNSEKGKNYRPSGWIKYMFPDGIKTKDDYIKLQQIYNDYLNFANSIIKANQKQLDESTYRDIYQSGGRMSFKDMKKIFG